MKNLLLLILITACLHTHAQHTIEVKHTYYTMQYDTIQFAELIGFYVQTQAHITQADTQKIDRKTVGRFMQDLLILARYQVANDNEYTSWNKAHPDKKRDRGHINPYSAFNFDLTAAKESMYFTNTCPQVSYFNEHQWEQLEMYVLKNVCPKYGDVKVWTGVLISVFHPKMMNKVPEPDYYWKVIEYLKNGVKVQEAWLGLNDESNTSTNPADIVSTPAHVRDVIMQYYPKMQVPF